MAPLCDPFTARAGWGPSPKRERDSRWDERVDVKADHWRFAMKHHIFISYPVAKQDLVENFAGRLRELGVEAWVYSLDKTLAEGIWEEIEAKIAQADLFLFVASQQSVDAKGQHRELVDRL
jgi:TIR domain